MWPVSAINSESGAIMEAVAPRVALGKRWGTGFSALMAPVRACY